MLINLTLGGLAVFFIVLFLAFLATKIIIKQTATESISNSNSNLLQIEPGTNGLDWNSSDDDEDDEQDLYIFDDNSEIKKDIFIIGERNTESLGGDFTTKSSNMMRDVRKNLQFSKLFKQKRKEI